MHIWDKSESSEFGILRKINGHKQFPWGEKTFCLFTFEHYTLQYHFLPSLSVMCCGIVSDSDLRWVFKD